MVAGGYRVVYDESVSILPFLSNVNKMSTTKAMETSDTIIVHDPKLLRDILGPDRGDVVRQRVRHLSANDVPATDKSPDMEKKAPKLPQVNFSVPVLRKSKVVLDKSTLQDLEAVQRACSDVLHEEQCLMQEIDDFLQSENSRYEYKRTMLYQKWLKNVFDPLLNKLHLFTDRGGYEKLYSKKSALFNDYLDYRNRKLDVFLDTLTTEDCSPSMIVEQIRSLQKISTSEADDPLTSQTSDYKNEAKLIQNCDEGLQEVEHVGITEAISSVGRQDTGCSLWMAMQLVDIDSSVRQKSQVRQRGIQTKSIIHPEEWFSSVVTPQDIKEELEMPHKKDVPHSKSTLKMTWDVCND